MTTATFSRIALLGPGLLGGSLAMTLRERCPETRIRIWGRRLESVEEVRSRGLAELASTDLQPVVEGADLVIFCVPVEAMSELASRALPHLSPNTILTDVGSVKAPVVKDLESILTQESCFVGSHPMAGSEQAGLGAARADLFEGSVCIVTPTSESNESAVERIEGFWDSVGCRVRRLSPEHHDEVIALVSHLPHLLAAALAKFVADRDPEAFAFCGPGFRDTTRVASGPPEMWTGIFSGNRQALRTSLEALIEMLNETVTLLDAFDQGRMLRFLTEARDARDRLMRVC